MMASFSGIFFYGAIKIIITVTRPLPEPYLLVAPLASQLECGLHRFSTGVHGQNHVEAKVLGDILCILAKDVVVKGT